MVPNAPALQCKLLPELAHSMKAAVNPIKNIQISGDLLHFCICAEIRQTFPAHLSICQVITSCMVGVAWMKW